MRLKCRVSCASWGTLLTKESHGDASLWPKKRWKKRKVGEGEGKLLDNSEKKKKKKEGKGENGEKRENWRKNVGNPSRGSAETEKTNKNEDDEELRSELLQDVPEWLQDLKENLVDHNVQPHQYSPSSSHEFPMEL